MRDSLSLSLGSFLLLVSVNCASVANQADTSQNTLPLKLQVLEHGIVMSLDRVVARLKDDESDNALESFFRAYQRGLGNSEGRTEGDQVTFPLIIEANRNIFIGHIAKVYKIASHHGALCQTIFNDENPIERLTKSLFPVSPGI